MQKQTGDALAGSRLNQDTTGQGKRRVSQNLILHIHPNRVPAETLRFNLTFGLGGMAATLGFLLAVSGFLLLLVYQPVPEKAYYSILALENNVVFGRFVRNIHYWSGNALIVVVILHILRVFFTGAFHDKRRINWVVGWFLLAGILASSFTGYLLPWDQLAYWAITICIGMMEYIPGGEMVRQILVPNSEVGGQTLLIFYILHTTVIPVSTVVLLLFHFWKIRKAGGVIRSSPAGASDSEPLVTVPAWPDLLLREAVIALVVISMVLMCSAVFMAPLGELANPGMSPNPAKAPWYFLGLQELLLHFHPLFAVFIIPLSGAVVLLALPYLKYGDTGSGTWFLSARGKRAGAVSLMTAIVLVPLAIVLDEYTPDLAVRMPGLPAIVSNGLVPFTIVLVAVSACSWMVKRGFGLIKSEVVQSVFILLLVAFAVLTVTGIWFRGEQMRLVCNV